MSKVFKNLMVVIFMFVFCGVGFGGEYDPIYECAFVPNESSEFLSEEIGDDIIPMPTSSVSILNMYAYGYFSFEDEEIEKILPYLKATGKVHYGGGTRSNTQGDDYYNSSAGNFNFNKARYEDKFYSNYYGNHPYEDHEYLITVDEMYKKGVIFDNPKIARMYSWIGSSDTLKEKFGYERASLEYFVGPDEALSQEYIDRYNGGYYYPENPNRIWTLYANILLKDEIDNINANYPHYSNLIYVWRYVDEKPEFLKNIK